MTTMWCALIVFWLICSVIQYGVWFGFFQREFPTIADKSYHNDKMRAIISALLGPIGLFASFLCGFFKHGFKWR